jgi:hypothetical protein
MQVSNANFYSGQVAAATIWAVLVAFMAIATLVAPA